MGTSIELQSTLESTTSRHQHIKHLRRADRRIESAKSDRARILIEVGDGEREERTRMSKATDRSHSAILGERSDVTSRPLP